MSIVIAQTRRRPTDEVKLPEQKGLDAELCNIGGTLRRLQPPGGSESGIFDVFRLPAPVLPSKKMVKNYVKSQIFDIGPPSPPKSRPLTPASESTFCRLFPASGLKPSRARHNNLKSTVFEPDPAKKPPVPFVKRDPITGQSCKSTDEIKAKTPRRRVRNPITFEGISDMPIPSLRCTQPPGGKPTFVLEYVE